MTAASNGLLGHAEQWSRDSAAPAVAPIPAFGPVPMPRANSGAILAAIETLDAHVEAMARVREPLPAGDAAGKKPAKKRAAKATSPDGLLTVHDVAEHFGVSVPKVLRWIAAGDLSAINVGASKAAKRPTWRVTREALEEFEAVRGPKPGKRTSARRRKDTSGDVIRFY